MLLRSITTSFTAAGLAMLALVGMARAQGQRSTVAPASAVAAAGEASLGASASAAASVDDSRRFQVQAAAGNASLNLREQVLRMPLAKDVDVRLVVERTGAADEFNRAVQRAQQIGGPRWVDDHTCQVRLEVPGSQLSEVLVAAARQHVERSPIPPEALKRRLGEWDRMTFFAIGSSAGGGAIEMARPHYNNGAWTTVDEATRRKAVTEARQDAVKQVLDGISPVALDETLKVQDALARPQVNERVGTWLNQKVPVTRLEFLEDLKVSVTLAPSPRALGATLQTAVTADKEFVGLRSFDWGRVQQDLIARVVPVIGMASVVPPAPSALSSIVLPIQPPDWVEQLIDAEATSSGGGAGGAGASARLKVARAAQSAASEQLRQKFLALRINAQMTLAEAAQKDPRLAEAVDRAMLHARITKVDYRADGSVMARVTLDLQSAWDELRANP